jgi:hypothetical protein
MAVRRNRKSEPPRDVVPDRFKDVGKPVLERSAGIHKREDNKSIC